jgi:uncharacterized delta-60 repeat protein
MRHAPRVTLFLSILLLGAFGASQAHAAGGDLDRNFAKGGKALRDLGGDDSVADVVTQRDRKVLALVELAATERVGVMRLKRNGRLDKRFGRNGIARINVSGDEEPGGLDLAANGRIIASFTSQPSGADSAFGVARFLRNGNPDDSLDGDGVQTSGFGTGFNGARANDVAAAPGGDIVAAGWVDDNSGGGLEFAIARFNPNGELDSAFAGDGRQITDFEGFTDVALGVDVDSEGRVVAVGSARQPGCCVELLAVARYDTTGQPDSSFSGDGEVTSSVAPEGDDVVALPGGRLAVAGTVSGDFVVARLTAGGDPDATFSKDGAQTVDFADAADRAAALARSGSKLVVTGTARTARRGRDFGVARLNANGTMDRRFSDDGRRAIDLAKDEDNGLGVAVDRTGDVVVGGSVQRRSQTDTGIVRVQGKGGRR